MKEGNELITMMRETVNVIISELCEIVARSDELKNKSERYTKPCRIALLGGARMEKIPVKTVMAILIENRKETAERVQKILTAWGCLIKTRLGLHDGVLDNCSDAGLIVLELVGNSEQHKELCDKLNKLPGVRADYMELSFGKRETQTS